MPRKSNGHEDESHAEAQNPKYRVILPVLFVYDPNLKQINGRAKTLNRNDPDYDPDDIPHWYRKATFEEVELGYELSKLKSTLAGHLRATDLQKLIEYEKLEEEFNKEAQDDDVDP